MKTRLVAVVWALLAQAACAANEAVDKAFAMPEQLGEVDSNLKNGCPVLSGTYALLGKLVSGRTSSPVDLELESVLGAPYLQAPYNPNNKLYAEIFFKDDMSRFQVDIHVGSRSQKWLTQSFVCDQGWLKLSRRSEGGSEGNDTRVEITSYLRKNTEGDLIVFQTVKGRTTNLFGLARANIDDSAWLRFKRVE
jgi:hypothetical protein